MEKEVEVWISDATTALHWFIETVGEDEWHRRRKNVVEYFVALNKKVYSEQTVQSGPIDKLFLPIAVYKDWLGWYMYLVESLMIRPFSGDPVQGARIYQFFTTIGRNITALKEMEGIEKRLKDMVNERQNQPDSTLFELVVAALYARNGWQVTFLDVRLVGRTPDFEVSRDKVKYWVECKRLAKITAYSDAERAEWQKRFQFLANGMRMLGKPMFVNIVFNVPLEKLPMDILAKTFIDYLHLGYLSSGKSLTNNELNFSATFIDLPAINRRLAAMGVKVHSPQMIEVLTGEYDMHGNYTPLIGWSETFSYGEDDGLQVQNQYIEHLKEAYIAKWECVAEESIDRKAKDIKKILGEAISQFPEEGEGIVHIGYETVNGPAVALRRHEKINEAIASFDFGTKAVESIVCHAIQPLAKAVGWECAETAVFFGNDINNILPEKLLLDPSGKGTSDNTHWEEDLGRNNGN